MCTGSGERKAAHAARHSRPTYALRPSDPSIGRRAPAQNRPILPVFLRRGPCRILSPVSSLADSPPSPVAPARVALVALVVLAEFAIIATLLAATDLRCDLNGREAVCGFLSTAVCAVPASSPSARSTSSRAPERVAGNADSRPGTTLALARRTGRGLSRPPRSAPHRRRRRRAPVPDRPARLGARRGARRRGRPPLDHASGRLVVPRPPRPADARRGRPRRAGGAGPGFGRRHGLGMAPARPGDLRERRHASRSSSAPRRPTPPSTSSSSTASPSRSPRPAPGSKGSPWSPGSSPSISGSTAPASISAGPGSCCRSGSCSASRSTWCGSRSCS